MMPLPEHRFRPHMILADREEAIRLALGDYFRSHGFEVSGAGSRAEAEELLARRPCGVLLTDRALAEGVTAGLELGRLARSRFPRTVVCLLAPPLTADETREALQAADLVLTRPRPLPEIAAVLFALLPPEVLRALNAFEGAVGPVRRPVQSIPKGGRTS